MRDGILRGLQLVAIVTLCVAARAMAQAPLVVKIGHVAPTSGWASGHGIENERAARLAIEQTNALGVRIGGATARFELVTVDDRHGNDEARNVDNAQRAARALVDAGVRAVIGHIFSGSTIAAAPTYADAGIAQITPLATNPAFTRQGWKTAFRLVADDTRITQVLARHVVGELGRTRVALLDNGTVYGRGLAELFAQAVTAAGGQVVTAQRVEAGSSDFAGFIGTAAEQRADVVFFGGFDPQAGRLLRQMNARGLPALFASGDGPCTPDMVSYYAAGNTRDGQVLCVLLGGAVDVGAAPGFVADYTRRFGAAPMYYGALAYDAVRLVADAMVRAGSAEPAQYLPWLAATKDFAGASGRITFDARGDLEHPTLGLFTYRNEALQLVRVVR